MFFNSFAFFAFLLVVYSFFLIAKTARQQNLWLLGASYFFYGFWDWRFLSLIFTVSVTDYFVSRAISSQDEKRKKRWLLALSLFVNLSILGTFKYFNFFVGSFQNLLAMLGFYSSGSVPRLLLPVGISFFTFQSMSHSIDVYRGQTEAPKNILNYLLFVSFFPQLVAGPIMRSKDLLPQIEEKKNPRAEGFYYGSLIILWGLFKKVAIADNLAVYVDAVYSNSSSMGSLSLILGALLFAFQIFCDFSGYSDIAVGIGRLFGVNLTWNFNAPYFAQSFGEFWSRWHITLSTWFRDYVYIPLGGNRTGTFKHLRNLFITFLVSGLWHGAAWNFVAWGGLHGFFLIGEYLFFKKRSRVRSNNPIIGLIRVIVVFSMVTFAWGFFRASSITHAFEIISGIVHWRGGFLMDNILLQAAVPLAVLLVIETLKSPLHLDEWLNNRSPFVHLIGALGLVYMVIFFGAKSGAQFIYFQF